MVNISSSLPGKTSFVDLLQLLVDSSSFRSSLPTTTTIMSPAAYRIAADVSPARSTPCLDYDIFDYNESPPDDFLATPDMGASSHQGRLRSYSQMSKDDEHFLLDSPHQYPLPTFDPYPINQSPLLSELPPPLPPWPHTTIAPKDAFPDYQEVCKFLQEQARPTSPSAFSTDSTSSPPPYSTNFDNDFDFATPDDEKPSSRLEAQPTPSTSATSPTHLVTPPAPSRRIGKKIKREEDDDDDDEYAPAPKRRMLSQHSSKTRSRALSPSDDEADDEDGVDFDDEFRPVRRLPLPRRKPQTGSRGGARSTASRPQPSTVRRGSHPKSRSNRGEDYQEGPCECQDTKCLNCQMTCFYTFVHGPRKGEVCKRLFESGRHLDLKRHKATHAVQEWKWLQDGEITLESAHWYAVVFDGKQHGLVCPNGKCTTSFTRYDALKRHMERGTCQYAHLESSKEGLDSRMTKLKIIQESDEKWQRLNVDRAAEGKQT